MQSRESNPWAGPSFAPDSYVLEADYWAVKRHNDSVGDQKVRFILESMPEPYIGNPDLATVVLLGKNPGHAEADINSYKNPAFREAIFSNLQHGLQEFPFYPLNPAFRQTGAGQWWFKCTRGLREAGIDASIIAKRLMVIEWIPYHSSRFKKPKNEFASQKYSFWLAREMLKTKLVVRMRGKAEWATLGPEFASLPALANPQCGHISRGNTSDELFRQIVEAFRV